MWNNPELFRFINDMISNQPHNSQLMTLQVKNSILEGRRYEEVYNYLLHESPVKILLIGVFTYSRYFIMELL